MPTSKVPSERMTVPPAEKMPCSAMRRGAFSGSIRSRRGAGRRSRMPFSAGADSDAAKAVSGAATVDRARTAAAVRAAARCCSFIGLLLFSEG